MDFYPDVESVNASSIALIDDKAREVELGILSHLDRVADHQTGSVDMSMKQYKSKLNDIALLRRTHAGLMNAQVERNAHQWDVKTKFFEADLESKRIFEEVQKRIKAETAKRLDDAKEEVALQIQNAAQSAMDSTKQAVKSRVQEKFMVAKERTHNETAQIWAEQQKQKHIQREEFKKRLEEHKVALIKAEVREEEKFAADVNKKKTLSEEFRVFALQNSDKYDSYQGNSSQSKISPQEKSYYGK